MTHKEFAETDDFFKKCCEAAGVPNTKRQASKYKMGKGKAFAKRTHLNEGQGGVV